MSPKYAASLLVCLQVLTCLDVYANCRAEISGHIENQIGTIVLFSSREQGPEHKLFGSEFWAIAGPDDTAFLHAYPVRFADQLMPIVNSWDWKNAAVSPIVRDVLVDVEMDDDRLWIVVKKILTTDAQYEEAIRKYPEAREGTCGSWFSRK
jgi:hypothetical protein